MAVDTEKLIQQYIENNKPTDALSHALTFAYCKVMFGAVQKTYAELAQISDRALRNYISDNREEFDTKLVELEAEKEDELDLGSASLTARALSEEQLDAFINNIFKRATSKDASVREWEFFLNFTGLQAQDVLNLQEAKAKSLRWWIKGELPSIKRYLNTKTLGLMTETSNIVYRGNKDSAKNAQAFVDADVQDETFARELMYWGAVHLSMMNNVEHPDLELLATAVRLDRLSKGSSEVYNKFEVKKYAEGDFTPKKHTKSLDELLLELCIMDKGVTKGTEEFEELKTARVNNVAKAVKPPELDKADVQVRASKYEDELRVLLTAEEEIRHMMNEITQKVNLQKGAR
ncbi:hypothetical protein Q75_09720 [Bacillus coahuilensis p1.1.43]|uniref:Uncharacterized protein n=1 Tax=Bacillus coahuilensis p1.1.43 TaxID=1150625 RepID=A0A147K7Y4_9BACI|nr:hypothetical protein [Bacillus coahuilensis]KUP06198.1 hypothetical protein Q75_09720 [Bacillus coahuilensis p1.1.43]